MAWSLLCIVRSNINEKLKNLEVIYKIVEKGPFWWTKILM